MNAIAGTFIGGVMGGAVVAPLLFLRRDRALDLLTIQLAAIAAIYVGFGLVDARISPAAAEIAVALVFFVVSVAGRWASPVLLAVGYFAHGGWDAAHHVGVVSTTIPNWYPSFCWGYDLVVAAVIWVSFRKEPVDAR